MRKLPAVWLAIVGYGVWGVVLRRHVPVLDAASLVRDGGFESKKVLPFRLQPADACAPFRAHWEQPTEGTLRIILLPAVDLQACL